MNWSVCSRSRSPWRSVCEPKPTLVPVRFLLLSQPAPLHVKSFESLSTVTVMLVGAGETIELVARHLREHKVKKMIIANRTRERAQVLADEVGAEVVALSDIDERLKEADIIISSTASPCQSSVKGWWSAR